MKYFGVIPGIEYITADRWRPAMTNFDIANIPYDDGYFDLVICSHVLDVVDNDKDAIRELFRVLRANGSALILVGVNYALERTAERPPPNAPLRPSDSQCIRVYGADFSEQLESAGFKVECIRSEDIFSYEECVTWRLAIEGGWPGFRHDEIHLATKTGIATTCPSRSVTMVNRSEG